MKRQVQDEELIELIEGTSNEALEKVISEDPKLQKRFSELKELVDLMGASEEVEVPSTVKAGFLEALANEKQSNQKPTTNWSWMQVAAAIAFLCVGYVFGTLGRDDQSAELAQLREEIRSLNELTLTSTLQKHSASQRIWAVNQIEQKAEINSEFSQTLLRTLNSDESTNVRYAALQALRKYTQQQEIRAQLVKSLESQTDPLIQISLIQLLVESEEKSAVAPIKDILENQQTAPEVKQQAEVALKVLT